MVEERAPVVKLEEGGYVKTKNRTFIGRIEQEGKKDNYCLLYYGYLLVPVVGKFSAHNRI